MKKLVRILALFLSALLLLAIVLMAFSPKNLVLEESINIDAPANVSYNLVDDLKDWQLWSPWAQLDPDALNTYTDVTSGVGAKWNWKGNEKIGEGAQTILESSPSKVIKMALEFNGWNGESYSHWKFDEANGKTMVTWDFQGSDTAFPFRPFNLIMKGALKKSYKKGLESLKEIVEKRANDKIYRGYKIKIMDLEERHYVMQRQEIAIENIQQFYAQNLGSLFSKIQQAGLEMDGMLSGLFFKHDPIAQKTDMAAAIPVSSNVSLSNVSSYTTPAGKAVQLDYRGDYHNLYIAHNAIDDYLKDHKLLSNSPVVEEYLTDPGKETDPEQWLTRISYYLSGN